MPLGLLATEGLVATAAWEQGQLPLLVADLFPPPRFEWKGDGRHLYFDYDGTVMDANLSKSTRTVLPVYPRGLRRGFTLVGTIPPSLSVGLARSKCVLPWLSEVGPLAYVILRVSLTLLILTLTGILFSIQARWSGLIFAALLLLPGTRTEEQARSWRLSLPGLSSPWRGAAQYRPPLWWWSCDLDAAVLAGGG